MADQTVTFTLRADTAQGIDAIRKMTDALRGVGDKAEDSSKRAVSGAKMMGGALHEVRTIVMGLGAAFGVMSIGELFRGWVRSAVEFDKQMASVANMLDENTVSVDRLREGIRGLGANLGSSAEMAKAMALALQAGIDPAKSVKFVEDAAKFAKAATMDTTESVDLLTTVINSYGMEAQQAATVSDMLFQVIRKGKVEGNDLNRTFGILIPTASQLGIGLDQLGAAFATIAQKGGVPARMAAAGLNQVLIQFLNPSREAVKLAHQLGVELSASHLQKVGLAQALGELAEASKKSAEGVAMFFGSQRTMRAALALTADGAADYTKHLKEMNDVQGLTAEAMERIESTLGDKMEDFYRSLGKSLGPVLRDVLEMLKALITTLQDGNGVIGTVGQAVGWLAKQFLAGLVQAIELAMVAFDKVREKMLLWYHASVAQLAGLDNLLGAASPLKGMREWMGREMVWAEDQAKKAGQSADWWWNKMKGLSKSLEGTAESENRAKDAGQALIDQWEAQWAATHKLTEGTDGLNRANTQLGEEEARRAKAIKDAYAPVDGVVNKIKEEYKVTGDIITALQNHKKELTEAIAIQAKHGVAVSDTAIRYKEMVDDLDRWGNKSEDVGKTIIDLDQIVREHTLDVYELRHEYNGLMQELDKLQPKQVTFNSIMEKFPTYGAKIPQLFVDAKGKVREFTEKGKEDIESLADVWKRQVSTIASDTAKAVTDTIFNWQGMKSLVDIIKDLGKSMLRALVETFLNPLQKLLAKMMSSIGESIINAFTGKSSGGGIGNFFGSIIGGIKGLFTGGGGAAAIGEAAPMMGTNWLQAGIGLGGSVAGGASLFGGTASAATSATTAGSTAAASGGGLGGILGSIGHGFMTVAAAIPVWGWVAIGAAALTGVLIKIFHKSTAEAAAKEAARDFGGISVGKDIMKSFFKQVGLSEKQAEPIRKDLESSPKFLTEVAWQAAQAQGRTAEFLTSLEQVKTSWGTFNFRDPFEQWLKTGSADSLNKAFTDAFGQSKKLVEIMPDFANVLAAAGTSMDELGDSADQAATDLKNLRDYLASCEKTTKTVWATFQETGAVTEELRKSVEDLGGDIGKFEELSRLNDVDKSFQSLNQHFLETGEILPELRQIVKDFGGDLSILDQAAELPALKQTLSDLQDLKSGLNDIMPDVSPIQSILNGEWGPDTWGQLEAMNLDPAKLTKMTDLVKYEKGWDSEVADFQKTGTLKKGGLIEQGLYQYGGAPGMTALNRYAEGYNTITPQLLSSTKDAIDAAYKSERSVVFEYIDSVTSTISDKANAIQQTVETELTRVGGNITDAIDKARLDVIAELDKILGAVNGTSAATVLPPETSPAVAAKPSPGTTGTTGTNAARAPAEVHVHLEGANIYGVDDLDTRVAQSVTTAYRRGGLVFAGAR